MQSTLFEAPKVPSPEGDGEEDDDLDELDDPKEDFDDLDGDDEELEEEKATATRLDGGAVESVSLIEETVFETKGDVLSDCGKVVTAVEIRFSSGKVARISAKTIDPNELKALNVVVE